MQQLKVADSAHWITLTYATDHLDFTRNGFKTLNQRHIQLFMKRLRKAHEGMSNKPIKYFYVGEYGGKRWRPHYHMTLFNAKRELIVKAWEYGSVFFGDVNEASIGYTLKYMMKPGKIPLHRNDDRVPEFRRMSKELGKNYLTPAMIKWHHADLYNRMYCVLKDGKKISMPRYYKNKVYDEHERIIVGHCQLQKLLLQQEELMKAEGYSFEDDRREAVYAAFQKMYKQSAEGRDKKSDLS